MCTRLPSSGVPQVCQTRFSLVSLISALSLCIHDLPPGFFFLPRLFFSSKSFSQDLLTIVLFRHYTTGLLVAAAFIVSTKQFVGDPIVCWCPAHFTDSHK